MVQTPVKKVSRLALGLIAFLATVPGPQLLAAEAPRMIRVPVWVFLEPTPGNGFVGATSRADTASAPVGKQAETNTRTSPPPARELRDLARYVLGGMVYGWKFSYTPSDRTRHVDEYFSLEPIMEIPDNDTRFSITGFDPAYPRVSTWAEFLVDEAAARRNVYWGSVAFRASDGRGYGERDHESEGIREAYSDAVRAAVRAFARKQEKNKPREINGEVLLKDTPRLFVSAGRFVVDLTVLMNITEMTPYSTF